MAVVALVLGLVWTRVPKATERAAPTPSETPVSEGTLVYAAYTRRGSAEYLWKLNLGTGTVDRGPRVPMIREIADASLVAPESVGLTVPESNGLVGAFILRGLSSEDTPTRLGEGSLVAWGPGGGEVAIASKGPVVDGCGPVSIEVVQVESGFGTRAFSEKNLCGGILSLGRDSQATYFTRASNGRVGISFVGVGLRHTLLSGYGMVSVSPATDFLVTPAGRLSRTAPGLGGTVLFWRGRGGLVPFGDGSRDLVVDRVLTWSQDSSEALVTGRLGLVPGLYRIGVGPSGVRQEPVFVAASGVSMGAAYSSDGSAYLALDGKLLRYANGEAAYIALPEGAPRPAGPLVWIP